MKAQRGALVHAGKNHAFCPGRAAGRGLEMPRPSAESAVGDFRPIDQES